MDEKIMQPEEAVEPVAPERRAGVWLIAGVALVVLVLAGAAFVGARLLRAAPAPAREGGMQVVAKMDGGAQRAINIKVVPAKELPQSEAILEGVFTKRQDNSIFLGTGDIRVMVTKEDDGSGSRKADFSGPVIEVVVGRDTQVWQDHTEMLPAELPATGDEVTIQQTVTPGSLDDLTENSTVSVWGERRGDRVVATVVVYRN
jgi:hypothetical protein